MANITINDIVKDPEFWKMGQDSQRQVLERVDPDFKALSNTAKLKIISDLTPKSEFTIPEKPEGETAGEIISREAAQTGGGIVGGVIGAMVPPQAVTVPAGVALGAMGGEAFRQIGQHVFGDPNAPKTSGEAAKRIDLAGAEQATWEVVGGVPTRLAGKFLAPLKTKLIPEAVEVIDKLANDIKPVLLPSEATKSRALDVLQNIAEGSILGGGKMMSFKNMRTGIINDWADDIINAMGQRMKPDELGEFFIDTINGKMEIFKAASQMKYNAVHQLAQGTKVSTSSLKAFAEPIKEISEEIGGIEAKNVGDDLVKAVTELPDQIDIKAAMDLRSRLMSRVDEFSVINKKAPAIGKAKKMIGIVDSEIESSLSPAPLSMWREANAFYKEGQGSLNNALIRRLLKYGEDTGKGPEMIGRAIFAPNGITTIRKIRTAVSDPTDWEKFQSFFVQDLYKKSLDTKTATLSGSKLLNNMFYKPSGIGEQTLREILEPSQITELTKLGNALKIAQERQSEGLGRMWIQLTQGGAIAGMAGGFITDNDVVKGTSAAILFGPAILSRMMLNPSIVKWLTKGFQLPANSPEIMGVLSRLIGASNRIRQDIYSGEPEGNDISLEGIGNSNVIDYDSQGNRVK